MQSLLSALIAAVPSAVSPEIATPMASSALKIFCCEEESSEAARLSVANTTYSLLCENQVLNGNFWKGKSENTLQPTVAPPCFTASIASTEKNKFYF
jgi:hypothetical protein